MHKPTRMVTVAENTAYIMCPYPSASVSSDFMALLYYYYYYYKTDCAL